MSEKKKWFDSSKVRVQKQLPEKLLAVSAVTYEECTRFSEAVKVYLDRRKIPLSAFMLWTDLVAMKPPERLTRNLKVVLGILGRGPIQSILWDGVLESERLMLLELEHIKAPVELKATAQGLLNLNERMHFLESVKEMYRLERLRHWE